MRTPLSASAGWAVEGEECAEAVPAATAMAAAAAARTIVRIKLRLRVLSMCLPPVPRCGAA